MDKKWNEASYSITHESGRNYNVLEDIYCARNMILGKGWLKKKTDIFKSKSTKVNGVEILLCKHTGGEISIDLKDNIKLTPGSAISYKAKSAFSKQ